MALRVTARQAKTSLPSTRSPGKPKPGAPPVQRDLGLPVQRLGDRPLIVLAEKDYRCGVHRGPDERLVHITLAGRAIAEVGDGRLAVLTDGSVALNAHRVAGGVQRLSADDDRVQAEMVRVRIPAAMAHATEQLKQLGRIQAAAPGDAVLPVGGERHVARSEGAA